MSRRTKLSRVDRAKRQAKRAHRAATTDERHALREAQRRPSAKEQFDQAVQAYLQAVENPIVSEVVCESCDLAQSYVTDDDETGETMFPRSPDGIILCRREELLGWPCLGEYCRTIPLPLP